MEEIQLDSKKPEDAIQIIDRLTYDKLNLTRREGDLFHSSLETLRIFVETYLNQEDKKTSGQKKSGAKSE